MDKFEKYVGVVFDNRYKIDRIIGIGGMAVVYKAIDLLMKRIVAVKMLRDEIAADEQSVRRFINESKAVAMLSHPNIVNIYDVSVRDNVKYIVMEYVEGITLKNYMTRKGILSVREIISYSEQILQALEHAHAKGIVHRDIKPHNIMLLKNGLIKVMDFGIAKLPNAETVTMTDKAIGTVYYISPEQASGRPIDARSDLYSLGVMMYEMGCAQLPFNADSPVSVALMQVNDSALPPRKVNAALPIGLEQIITRAMEKDPADRYQSAKDMLKHLLRLKENPHIVFRQVKKIKKQRKPHRASHAMLPIILGVAFAFLSVAAVSAVYALNAIFFSSDTTKAETITVVDLGGTTFSTQLQEWFDKSEYYTLKTVYQYDDEHPAGTIIDQDPKGGDHRKVTPGQQRCEITLTISQGAETFHLPDVVIYDYREADAMLKKLGLIVRVEKIYSETFTVGSVIRTEPEANTVMKKGDTVIIYASQGTAVGTVVVPQFVGLTEVQTLRKVIAAGLRVGNVTYEQSSAEAGTILSQDIAEFKVVHANTKISFVVSGGPDYMTDPFPDDPIPDDPWGDDNPEDTTEPEDTTDPADTDDPYANWEPEDGFGDTTEDPWKDPDYNQDIRDWLDNFLNRN